MGRKLLQWGMIGTGDVTEKKSAPSFNKIPGSRLVAVANRTPGKAEDYARRHGIHTWHRDPFDVIRDTEVDIVYIATPPGSHPEYALEAIRAGKPVYIEKPMARTYRECQVINKAAEKAAVPVYVAYYRRALEYFKTVQKIVGEGKLGKITKIKMQLHVSARPEDHDRQNLPWRVIPEISGGGYFHDMGCHALDILFYIFGDPVGVNGAATNKGGLYEAADTISATLTLPQNIQVNGSWSFVTAEPEQNDLVELTGEKGRLEFSIFSFEPIHLILPGGVQIFNPARPEHIQMPLIQTIVNEMNGKGTCPSTGLTAAVTSQVMDQVTGTFP
jgi:predicted dehydrogenase